MKKLSFKILLITAFAVVIFSPSTAFNGTVSGLKLWALTILPSLFPALIITSCILQIFPMGQSVSYIYILLTGILCGFPVGAYLCGDFHSQYPNEPVCPTIAAFCNISSPSFVINYITYSVLKDKISPLQILLCIYLPVLECILAIIIIYKNYLLPKKQTLKLSKTNYKITKSTDITSKKIPAIKNDIAEILDEAIWKSIKNMLKLGGYIVIFSCLANYILLLPIKNEILTAVLCAITEITNGIYLCSRLHINPDYIAILIAGANAFGGISTIMQTMGITKDTGISIKKYVFNKLLFTIITIINAWFIICIF